MFETINNACLAFSDIQNTGSTTIPIDLTMVNLCLLNCWLEGFVVLESFKHTMNKQDFYTAVENYLDQFETVEQQDIKLFKFDTIVDCLNVYCSKSALTKIKAKIKKPDKKLKIKDT